MAEPARRLVHASGAVVPALHLFEVLTWRQLRILLVAGAALVAVLEAARLLAGVDWPLFDRLIRDYEAEGVAGYALYVAGGTATVLLFPPMPAVSGLFVLTLADPVSGVLGTGELRPVKRPRVLVAMFAVSTLIAAAFLPPLPAVLGGLAAAVADGVKPAVRGHVVDDNLTIPLAVSGTATAALAVM